MWEETPTWLRNVINPDRLVMSSAEVEAQHIIDFRRKGWSADTVKKNLVDTKYEGMVDFLFKQKGNLNSSEDRDKMIRSAVREFDNTKPIAEGEVFKGWRTRNEIVRKPVLWDVLPETLPATLDHVVETSSGMSSDKAVAFRQTLGNLDKFLDENKDDYKYRRAMVESTFGSLMTEEEQGLMSEASSKAGFGSNAIDVFSDNRPGRDLNRKKTLSVIDEQLKRAGLMDEKGTLLTPENRQKRETEGKLKNVLSMAWATNVTPEMMGLEDVYRQVQMSVLKSPLEQEQESKNLQNLEQAIRELGKIMSDVAGTTNRWRHNHLLLVWAQVDDLVWWVDHHLVCLSCWVLNLFVLRVVKAQEIEDQNSE